MPTIEKKTVGKMGLKGVPGLNYGPAGGGGGGGGGFRGGGGGAPQAIFPAPECQHPDCTRRTWRLGPTGNCRRGIQHLPACLSTLQHVLPAMLERQPIIRGVVRHSATPGPAWLEAIERSGISKDIHKSNVLKSNLLITSNTVAHRCLPRIYVLFV